MRPNLLIETQSCGYERKLRREGKLEIGKFPGDENFHLAINLDSMNLFVQNQHECLD